MTTEDVGDIDDGDPWWCWECHGLGGWDDDEDFSGDYVDCPCCGGEGHHHGTMPPPCAPGAAAAGENTPP